MFLGLLEGRIDRRDLGCVIGARPPRTLPACEPKPPWLGWVDLAGRARPLPPYLLACLPPTYLPISYLARSASVSSIPSAHARRPSSPHPSPTSPARQTHRPASWPSSQLHTAISVHPCPQFVRLSPTPSFPTPTSDHRPPQPFFSCDIRFPTNRPLLLQPLLVLPRWWYAH